jgi:AcrR family transcriptional regulator
MNEKQKLTERTKEKLLFCTFKLLVQSTYDRVTFDEIEKATGLTRGAVSYHFKTKENLFMEVIEEYVFKRASILQIPVRGNEACVLKKFIGNFIKHCHAQTEQVRQQFGVENFNMAYSNLENQGLFFYPNFKDKVLQWLDVEKKVWADTISAAIRNNEIKNSIDVERFASIFVKLYLGDSYIGVFHETGQDLKELEKDFLDIYNLMKA